MIAKFIGEDGSMGFKNGKKYDIQSKCWNNTIVVKTTNDRLSCPYGSIESFLKNWEIEQK